MRPGRLAVIATSILCLAVSVICADDGLLEVHFIDVGQGDCTFVSCPDGENILVDCGTSQDGDGALVRQYLQKVLDSQSVDIDTLVVTHPDQDHYNLLRTVIADDAVGQVFKIGSKSDYKIVSGRNWLYGHKDKFINHGAGFFDAPGFPNSDIECGDAEVYVLAWNVKARGSNRNRSNHKVNARSIVLLFLLNDFDVILTGDATVDTEATIMSRYGTWLRSEVLKVGHHGSGATSTSTEWASAVNAEYAFVSADQDEKFGHPRQEIIFRLDDFVDDVDAHAMRWWTSKTDAVDKPSYTKAIYSTATNGNIVISSDGSMVPTIQINVPFD